MTRLILMSAIVAMAIVGQSDAVFLIGYYGYMKCMIVQVTDWRPDWEPEYITRAALWGILPALGVASILRWLLWPTRIAPTPIDERKAGEDSKGAR